MLLSSRLYGENFLPFFLKIKRKITDSRTKKAAKPMTLLKPSMKLGLNVKLFDQLNISLNQILK